MNTQLIDVINNLIKSPIMLGARHEYTCTTIIHTMYPIKEQRAEHIALQCKLDELGRAFCKQEGIRYYSSFVVSRVDEETHELSMIPETSVTDIAIYRRLAFIRWRMKWLQYLLQAVHVEE